MALGREMLLRKNNVVLAGMRDWRISWSGESVDFTSGEDGGVRLLEALSAQEQIDISADFILKDHLILAIVLDPAGPKMLTDIDMQWPIITPANSTRAGLSGDFRISSFEQGNPYKDAITGSMTLESSGVYTFTAEAL